MTGQARESCFLPEAHKPHSWLPKLQLALGDVIHREALGVNSHSWATQGQLQLAGWQPLSVSPISHPHVRACAHTAQICLELGCNAL